MSEQERIVLVACLWIAAITWGIWLFRGRRLSALMKPGPGRWALAATPPLCALGLFAVLRWWSASDVRGDWAYLLFYQILGAAWVGLASVLLPWFGISPRDDVLERRNRAAAWALGGALLGVTACYAGANIGDGPGWWVVVYCAALATAALFVLWFVLERIVHVSDSVTIERDGGSALRLAGFLVGSGLILGRAVAGDWTSIASTNADFLRLGWPAVALLGAACLFESALRPARDAALPSALVHGLLPGAFHLAAAIGWLAWVGPWR